MANYGTGSLGKSQVGGAGGAIIIAPPATQTPSAMDISGLSGNTLATWHSFTFVVFVGTIDIDGETFGEGTYSYGNGAGILNAMAYDATGSSNTKLMIQI